MIRCIPSDFIQSCDHCLETITSSFLLANHESHHLIVGIMFMFHFRYFDPNHCSDPRYYTSPVSPSATSSFFTISNNPRVPQVIHTTPFYRRPYNLYCVGADVKPCSINQSINHSHHRLHLSFQACPRLSGLWPGLLLFGFYFSFLPLLICFDHIWAMVWSGARGNITITAL